MASALCAERDAFVPGVYDFYYLFRVFGKDFLTEPSHLERALLGDHNVRGFQCGSEEFFAGK